MPRKTAKSEEPAALRVIGGRLRGRRIEYLGDPLTRPMKDRVREAVFNLLGTDVIGAWAIDLFAGTGALGFEAISRGAIGASFCERHFPSAHLVEKNAGALEVANVCRVHPGDSFLWARKRPDVPVDVPWIVFCSPPYRLYVERFQDMLELLTRFVDSAPPKSVFVVESDDTFDHATLPTALVWDRRVYPPAIVSISAPSGPRAD